ncbi:hypothetical protein OJF2_27410 [Aquisphaera giovannonii]|uniref:DUF3006 domain-containing protein n=1 Tax=Aquisphaera giovannonii TaxID=406548 RepID=A0A5B9W0R8_9BACT|nr:DUF3006 domain-containing protein [Aquisphaera giovannonii]QEH34206.1 hypothetical protein OJF2_27410 [Aquisphaera giovannonii]
MRTLLSLDRFEGKGRSIAVLVIDDGEPIHVPRSLLPADAKAGDVLSLAIERDEAATRRLADDTREVQADLRATDPGGDIKL